MEMPKEVTDMLKQERKTTEARRCEKHNCDLVEIRSEGGFGPYEWTCQQCYDEEREQHRKRDRVRVATEMLNLPPRLCGCTLNNYKPVNNEAKKILADIVQYEATWPHSGGGLMLGGVGTGKTHLAAALCSALCGKGVKSKITNVNLIVRDVRSVWGGKKILRDAHGFSEGVEETEQDIINRYCNYDLLIIDEIGSQYGSDSERIIVNEIINNRYEMMKPTIAIGNVSVSEAKEILGERVVDRLKHGGFLCVFDWESYRK